jgi:hypothetical protein
VADEIEAEEPQKLRDRPPAPVNDGDIDKDEAAND